MSGDNAQADEQQTTFSRLMARRQKRAYSVYRISRKRKQRTNPASKWEQVDIEFAKLLRKRIKRLDRLAGITKRRELQCDDSDK